MSYEIAYCKWIWRHNRRLFFTYLLTAVTLLLLPQLLFPYQPNRNSFPPLYWSCTAMLLINLALAMLMPLYQFRYLMNKRSVDLFYPLPIKKTRLFWLNYVIGAACICIPNVLFLFSFLWTSEINAYIPTYLVLTAMFALMSLALYASITFFVMKCNSFLDACFVAVAVVLVQLLLVTSCIALLNNVIQEISHSGGSINEFFQMSYIECFSPIMIGFKWLSDLPTAANDYMQNGGNILALWLKEADFNSFQPIVYLFVTVGFSIVACRAYGKRKGEDSEQKTTSKLVYPMFTSLITCLLLLYDSLSASFFWVAVVLFFVMNSLAERKLTIRPKMLGFLFYGAILFLVSNLMIETNGFGRIREFYEPEDIQSVLVELHFYEDRENDFDASYETSYLLMDEYQEDQKLIEQVTALHRQATKESENGEINYMNGTVMVNYVLKNGRTAYRYFSISEREAATVAQLKQYLKQQKYSQGEIIIDEPYDEAE